MSAPRKKVRKDLGPTGIPEIDRLPGLSPCLIQDYITAVSAYVRQGQSLSAGPKKAGQIRLSNALARSLANELEGHLPQLKGRLITDEQKVAGGLRTANADVSESHYLDGLRLAVELKPINLAVGRAIWNRFGDIRTFAVNIHLKFPFAVVGGVLVIPSYEEMGTSAAQRAEQQEDIAASGHNDDNSEINQATALVTIGSPTRRSTLHLVDRAIERLIRAGGRKTEADAAHLLEGIAVVVYDPDTAAIREDVPKQESGLRWPDFVSSLASAYRARFEE